MKLKIMTFNLRIDNPGDGINCFDGRKARVKEAIMYEKPDVIGFQELSDKMNDWLRTAIRSKYEIVGTGRESNYTGEGARIAYNKKKFELLSLDTRWLSETPDVPGSRYALDQSTCPRVYTVVELVEKRSRKVVRVYNAHFDHVGEMARVCSAAQMIARISCDNARLCCPNVLMGDLNAYPDSNAVKTLNAHLTDITANIDNTFHGFGKRTEKIKIDYIYTDAKSPVPSYVMEDTSVDGVYISDHYPVCGFIEI